MQKNKKKAGKPVSINFPSLYIQPAAIARELMAGRTRLFHHEDMKKDKKKGQRGKERLATKFRE